MKVVLDFDPIQNRSKGVWEVSTQIDENALGSRDLCLRVATSSVSTEVSRQCHIGLESKTQQSRVILLVSTKVSIKVSTRYLTVSTRNLTVSTRNLIYMLTFAICVDMELKFIPTHNQVGYLAAPQEKHKKLYTSLIKGLNRCRLIRALRDNPVVYESFVQDFWKTAKFEAQGADGKGMIEAEIQKTKIFITVQTIREVLQFCDNESDLVDLPSGTVEAILPHLSYEGKYPSLVKKFLNPYWRLLAHMFILCMTENRGGTDQLNITQTAAFVALITNEPFNYSKYIFEGMKRNVTGIRKDKFIMYPRFLRMILNARYSDLE
ncbi:hypothetical protein HanPSC8_Chr14g0613981 [Helianthus annuus]|nr:hypothetical protein HanPSC8_Chr14g0613981 [Helianthus annuus]